jgi:hypothetical protein
MDHYRPTKPGLKAENGMPIPEDGLPIDPSRPFHARMIAAGDLVKIDPIAPSKPRNDTKSEPKGASK